MSTLTFAANAERCDPIHGNWCPQGAQLAEEDDKAWRTFYWLATEHFPVERVNQEHRRLRDARLALNVHIAACRDGERTE
jgi:hypothetical protein